MKNEGFSGKWSAYAEQLMIYILAIASPTFNVDKDVYDYFDKPKADYGNIKILYTATAVLCLLISILTHFSILEIKKIKMELIGLKILLKRLWQIGNIALII